MKRESICTKPHYVKVAFSSQRPFEIGHWCGDHKGFCYGTIRYHGNQYLISPGNRQESDNICFYIYEKRKRYEQSRIQMWETILYTIKNNEITTCVFIIKWNPLPISNLVKLNCKRNKRIFNSHDMDFFFNLYM